MIRKTVEGHEYESQMIGELHFDQTPKEGSFNPVTSNAVAKIAGGVADLEAIVPEGASEENKLATAADVAGVQADVDAIEGKIPSGASSSNKLVSESGLQDAIDAASESWSTGFTPKGESSVSDLNDLATKSNGDSYIVTDSGTLTDGSLAVVAGDQVAWDATNSVWYKLPQYAMNQFGTNAIKNLATKYKGFLVLDDADGTGKMDVDTIFNNFAEKFDPDKVGGYLENEVVVKDGKVYKFTSDHTGAWSNTDVAELNVAEAMNFVFKLLFDNSEKTITASSSTFYYFKIPFVKGMKYSIKTVGTSTYATLVNKKTQSATGQVLYQDTSVNKDFVANSDYLYLRVYIVSGSSVIVKVKSLEDYVNDFVSKLKSIVYKDTLTLTTTYQYSGLAPLTYEKGIVYKFTNTGTNAVAVYLMKTKSTQYAQIAVDIGTIYAGESKTYKVENVEFSWLNVYGIGSETGTHELKVEQLVSNVALQEKIEDLRETISGLVSNTIPSFSIIGDSYSTYQGFLADSNADSYYYDGGGTVQLTNGVKDTWWFKLANRMKSILFANNSWSGSTISDTVRPGLPATSSMVYRVDHAFGPDQIGGPKPNMIIFFGGTNDSWLENPMGAPKYSGWTSSDLLETLPALCYCFDKLLTYNPGVRIVFVLNTDLSETFNSGVATICEHYNVNLVVLNNINKSSGHPTSTGMQQICDQIYAVL